MMRDSAARVGAFQRRRVCAGVWLTAGFIVLLPAESPGAANDPVLVPVRKAHCNQMYGIVANRLKGGGRSLVSNTTRNGLKDFFVTRPGVIDCKGERAIPWTDAKDRDFIVSVLNATDAAFKKSKLDMAKDYGIAPAPASVSPPSR
jgi:hypothetical protein